MSVDLHCHSTASDGDLAPADVVARAATRGVRVLALTDHDSVEGLPEAIAAGARLGVRVVPGVELSVRAGPGQMHLLGYFPHARPDPLAGRLTELRARRRVRARRIVALLAEQGAPVAWEDVAARAAGAVGRPHLAEALAAAGHVADRQEAFDRYLAKGRPAYVPSDGLGVEEAVALVRASGGAAVLAHPWSLRLDPAPLDALVGRMRAIGLAGIEVHRRDQAGERHRHYLTLAERHDLVPAGGSDFHRPGDAGRAELGDTGAPPLPEGTVERLMARARPAARPPE